MTASVAFVTASYRLDRARCELLCRSLETCAPSVDHWIVVDRGDLPLFRSLRNHRTHVVAKEEVLPRWVHRLDTLRIGLRSNVWLQGGGLPIRGWLLQQLVKLAIAEKLTEDVVVHIDSDVVLLRPFSLSSLVDQAGRVRLFAAPDAIDESLPHLVRWHRSSEKLLGIGPAGLPAPNFISTLVPWKRANALALLDHVEKNSGRHWLRALADAWHVSEYTLYGRFAQDVLGASAGQFVSSSSLCHDYYRRVPLSVPEVETLLDCVGPEQIAVSLTSKAGMRPDDYVEVLERRWAALSTQETQREVAQPVSGGAEPRLEGPAQAGRQARGGRSAAVQREKRAAGRRVGVTGANRLNVTWALLALVAALMVLLELPVD